MTMDDIVVSDLEEQRTAIFVMQNFVPDEQRTRVDLDFIMQQLRPSPHFFIQGFPAQDDQSTSADDENSKDWQDLMQWTNPSLLDTIESRQVHLFQWETTYKYLADLNNGLRGTVVGTNLSRIESQRKEINNFMKIIRRMRTKVDQNQHDATNKKRMNVCWILWKLRGFLATIPTPVNKAAIVNAHVRLCKFHEELGITPFTKLNHWIVKNPEQYLLYLATVCWFPEPSHSTQNEAQVRS